MESVSSHNFEHIHDQDVAVQVVPLNAAMLITLKANLKQRWRLLGQAMLIISTPAPSSG